MKQYLIISLFIVHLTSTKTADWSVKDLVTAYNGSSNKLLFDPDGYLNDITLDQKTKDLIVSLQNQKAFITRIFLISGISNDYKRIVDKDIEKFVDDLSFQLLQNKQDEINSLFIVFAINDRQMRIRTGQNVRAILPDSKALSYLKSIKSYLQSKQYSYAINYLMQEVYDRITSPYTYLWDILETIGTVVVVVAAFIIAFFGRDKGQSNISAPVASRLTKIQRICGLNKPKKEIITTTCVICLEDFKGSDNSQQTVLDVNPLTETLKGHYDTCVVKIECGHSFHSGCITKWTSDHNTCPTCREKIDIEEDGKVLSQQLVAVQSTLYPDIMRLNLNHGSIFTWSSYSVSDRTGAGSGGGGWNVGGGGATSSW
jgi:uncharacterized membrane protein YgcG